MRPAAWDAWVAKARSVRIEDECSRRGIVFNGQAGKSERCGPCPKCGGEDRFAVNTKKQVFNCRGCSARGDVIAFVQFLDHSDFARAVEALTGEPPPKRVAKLTKGVVAAEYQYHTLDGTLAFIVERVEHQNTDGSFVIKHDKRKKTFRQKRPDPDRPGKWVWNTEGVPIIPYALPEVTAAIAGGSKIFIVEGEKCADTLRELGVLATTNPGGYVHVAVRLFQVVVTAIIVTVGLADYRPAGAAAASLHQLREQRRRHRLELWPSLRKTELRRVPEARALEGRSRSSLHRQDCLDVRLPHDAYRCSGVEAVKPLHSIFWRREFEPWRD